MASEQTKLVALLELPLEEAVLSKKQDIRATLMAGLTWRTNYWVDCALNWVEQGVDLDSEIISVLHAISRKKSMPQSTRHKAIKYARNWEKNNI